MITCITFLNTARTYQSARQSDTQASQTDHDTASQIYSPHRNQNRDEPKQKHPTHIIIRSKIIFPPKGCIQMPIDKLEDLALQQQTGSLIAKKVSLQIWWKALKWFVVGTHSHFSSWWHYVYKSIYRLLHIFYFISNSILNREPQDSWK